jgi:hypothetical protein
VARERHDTSLMEGLFKSGNLPPLLGDSHSQGESERLVIQPPKGVFCNVCMARICMKRHVFASPPSSIVEFLAPVAVCFSLANTTMDIWYCITRCQRLSGHRAVRGDNATAGGIVQHRVVIRDGNPPFKALAVTTVDTLLTDDDRCGLKNQDREKDKDSDKI